MRVLEYGTVHISYERQAAVMDELLRRSKKDGGRYDKYSYENKWHFGSQFYFVDQCARTAKCKEQKQYNDTDQKSQKRQHCCITCPTARNTTITAIWASAKQDIITPIWTDAKQDAAATTYAGAGQDTVTSIWTDTKQATQTATDCPTCIDCRTTEHREHFDKFCGKTNPCTDEQSTEGAKDNACHRRPGCSRCLLWLEC